jgi:uncharacterized protein YndB with AHSA1/START domain
MEFFGTYLEVTPHSRLVWTNEEGDQGKTVTTVTFDEVGGKTLLVMHDLYPSKEALEAGRTEGPSRAMVTSHPLDPAPDRVEIADGLDRAIVSRALARGRGLVLSPGRM